MKPECASQMGFRAGYILFQTIGFFKQTSDSLSKHQSNCVKKSSGLVGLIAYRYTMFQHIILMYFFSQNLKMIAICFLDKLIIKKLSKIKDNFFLCNTEETKTLIIPIYYE